MKYFILEEQQGNRIANITNWYGRIDVNKINMKYHKELPDILILDITLGLDAFYPDIIFFPFFLVSREVMEIIRMYDEQIPYHSVILNDLGETGGEIYFLPILDEITQLSELDEGNLLLGYIIVNDRKKILIRMDILESLLYRDIIGIAVKEM